ncbi:hypothetical protein QM012_001551 [Aureobasidium pullulans]|uniref:DUF6604 domain-containing protein n=1 Tax=Aureobasidium pullulans TaxID=5580 RepID=A0ABR0TFJ8_AURPU
MLPNSLGGSHTIYKEDTNSVATWPASTARKFSYVPSPLKGSGDNQTSQETPRPKGKARKLAKAAISNEGESSTYSQQTGSTTYTIAIRDFIPLAEYIVAMDDDAAATAGIASITNKSNTNQKLNASTSLEGLANSIHSEGMHLTFNYFRLHRFCWTLLRRMNSRCSGDLRDIFGFRYVKTSYHMSLDICS